MALNFVVDPAGGASVTEANGYSNFGTAADGDLGLDTSTNTYYKYNETTSLWLPPQIQPTTLRVEYTASDTPDNDGWTKEGNEGAAAASGVLTITDDGTGGSNYAHYYITDSTNFDQTNNIGVLMRARVTAQSAVRTGYKCTLSLRPGNTRKAASLALAGGTTGLGGADQVYPYYVGTGNNIFDNSNPDASPDNSAWQIWYIFYNATDLTYEAGVLGEPWSKYSWLAIHGDSTFLQEDSISFGTFSAAETCTLEVDYVYGFNW